MTAAQPWAHALAAYRGAPLGKPDTMPAEHFTGRIYAGRVRVNRSGYADDGTYWGIAVDRSKLLWRVHSSCGALDCYVRAPSAEAAKRRALARTPFVRVTL
jgi:hypothetical protein